ncbi:MAG: hypothetical protein KA533_05730 [Sphingobium sp.]|nr:hypothetical protein [Sphingobium sp.]MBP6111590.1 hypothetical protein [Sphingobium sp.]MBP8670961.1 hypothetical protein [Sphingobium sp.]MBP9158072.1 hypothetical protein [Sphingobium sp.]MCC6482010.1 hypothetical protein [Sphingomonadaceae bacterium]
MNASPYPGARCGATGQEAEQVENSAQKKTVSARLHVQKPRPLDKGMKSGENFLSG